MNTREITSQEAWDLALKYGKKPPYRGYRIQISQGLEISHSPDGKYLLIETEIPNDTTNSSASGG